MLATLAETPMTQHADRTRFALDFVHRLLVAPATGCVGLPDLLADLAAAFQAPSAGLANSPDGQECIRFPSSPDESDSLPWQDDPSLLGQTAPVPGAMVMERSKGSLLATSLDVSDGVRWILWLEDPARSSWSEGEAGALVLAGHTIARRMAGGSHPRWAEQLDRAVRQQSLETAAAVTRRLAHDFGNVLTGILGFTELALAQQIPANTSLQIYLQEVHRAAQAGAQLTNQLRLFSRRQSSTSRCCPLTVVLAEQEARLFSAREAGVNLRLNVPTDLPLIALDGEQLTCVLSALLDNAREALLGPGSISVSARETELTVHDCRDLYGSLRPGAHVEITIADTGVGLSPEVQRRLFTDPFFTTKPRRRGIGLSITYGILHAHRGGFRLYPGAEHGVVVRVLLPVAPAFRPSSQEAAVAKTEQVARPSERLRLERILLVEDEPEIRQFVASTLERAGYRVDGVNGGTAALENYFAQTVDPYRLVLTDVLMPGMGGVDLAIRLLKRDPSVRILFMSGHVSAEFTRQDFAAPRIRVALQALPYRPTLAGRAGRPRTSRRERRPTGNGSLGSDRPE